eukprot:NODE_896_length_2004_cov_199.587453_g848_i0.p1 GENE.NODE_896_length_2004_cov_199.587453_g848_i0~~NODE_896_length_2004_cov_199.587453_g848_i0.p1  ORF type:complete len:589 (-),score=75.00 NODE_896_length_2004_cov_199.587453_g848_i0:128-1894(-)
MTSLSSMIASAGVEFEGVAVGSRKHQRPKTGINEVDVELTIINRCLDRLLARRLEKDQRPPPNATHAALSPILSPIVPQATEARELETEDPSVIYNADGTIRPPTLSTSVSSGNTPMKSTPMPRAQLPPRTGNTAHSSSPIYKTTIGFDEAELEAKIMRRSIDNIVSAIIAYRKLHDAPPEPSPMRADTADSSNKVDMIKRRFGGLDPLAKSLTLGTPKGSILNGSLSTIALGESRMSETPLPDDSALPPEPTDENVLEGYTDEEAPPPEPDHSFWGQIIRYCHYGIGTYQFKIHEVGNRLTLSKSAVDYNLQYLADELFNFTTCVLSSKEIRYYVRSKDNPEESRPGHVAGLHKDAPPGATAAGERTVGRPCKGIIYFVGTMHGTKAWRNPTSIIDRPLLDVKVSSSFGSGKAADIVNAAMGYFVTQNKPDSWILIDFLHQLVIPKAYSFASSHPIYAGYYPRNWELQGSLDGKTWKCLKKHTNDQTVNKYNPIGYWLIEPPPHLVRSHNSTFYRYFRVMQTGVNSFESHELQISSVEIYGQFIYLAPEIPSPRPAPAWQTGHTRAPSPPPQLPPQPKAAAKKKARR